MGLSRAVSCPDRARFFISRGSETAIGGFKAGRRPLYLTERYHHQGPPLPMGAIDDIIADFEFLDDWEDRYRYLIELGRQLEPFPEALRSEATKVRGCVSQVWLKTDLQTGDGGVPRLSFVGDSDAHIVRGLIALLVALYSGQRVDRILEIDAESVLESIGLREHLTPQRSNGLSAMVERIRREAREAVLTD